MPSFRSADQDRPGRNPYKYDISNCDREPIHIPGMIQPHGVLFGLDPETRRLTAISENVGRYTGGAASDLIGSHLNQIIDTASFAGIDAAGTLNNGDSVRLARIRMCGQVDTIWRGSLHRNLQGLLLEAEPVRPADELSTIEHFARFHDATQRLHTANDIHAVCQSLVAEIHRLTGYDRVMLYRFAPDCSGEVVAEANNQTLSSYLGLHFPASDIPAQARALYVTNVERQIPDVGYSPVKLLCRQAETIDLSQVGLRSVSPLHLTYLRHMAVGASMSISVLHQGRLWGMVACHHHAPHHVAPELRQAGVLLAQFAAVRLGLLEEAQIARRAIAVKAVETRLLHEVADGQDYRAALLKHSRLLLDPLDATGLVLVSGGGMTILGDTPTGPDLDGLVTWLTEAGPELLETDHLAGRYPPASAWSQAAGLLSVPLGGVPQNLLVWFRPERARTVTWAGDPNKPAEMIDGEAHLTPRASFARWSEEVRGHARPWTADEIAAANGLRDTIVEIIVRRSQLLEQMNSLLSRSNEELEAFAYVASHDLKEPLRQIETFGTLLERAFTRGTDPAEKIARWFAGIHNSSRRLRLLINDLAEYSRLSGTARPFEPVDLNALLVAIIADFEGQVEMLGASIEIADLPTLTCDPLQIRQVLQNLIGNALKYRHPDRAPIIRIQADSTAPTGPQRKLGWPIMTLSVRDNGIGFDERYRDRIFEPFERLHSSDEYEGTGLGLAICRKVIDRHGGAIAATSQPGEGTVFTITLPLRPDATAPDLKGIER